MLLVVFFKGHTAPTAKAGEKRILFLSQKSKDTRKQTRKNLAEPLQVALLPFYPDDGYVYGSNDHTRKAFYVVFYRFL